jgi:hypothetical protein
MPTPSTLFKLLNESILLLLGALLMVLAASGRVGPPGRPLALAVLGIVLIYWGMRAWIRPGPSADRWQPRVRAGSLVLVGLAVLGIRYVPSPDVQALLATAGAVLVARGLVGGVLLVRQK